MVVAETVNRKGRIIMDGNMMTVQVRTKNRAGDECWRGVWSSECLDDEDLHEGVDFMEAYWRCQ
jgi:hypothetical protein